MTTENSRADALTEITERLQALTALKKRTDSMPVMNEWQWLNNLRNRLLAASPVEQPAAAPIDETEQRGYNEGFNSGWERGHVFGKEQSAGISEVLLSTIVRTARKGKSYVEGYGKAHQFLKDAGLLVDGSAATRAAHAPADERAEFEAIRNAALDEAAAVVTDHQREGREWVPQSLWDNLARECAARIRALKKAPIPEPAVEQHEATPADVCKQPSITPVDCVPGRGPFVINKDGRIDINPAFALSRPAADVVAKSPTVESETTAPKRAAQFLLMLEADTAEHLACALTDLETQIRSGRARTYSAGGNAFSSYKCRLTIADHPTHSEYMRELEQWLDRNTAANGGTA